MGIKETLLEVFQATEKALHPVEKRLDGVFHTVQDWSLLMPMWRDIGHTLGWQRLIDKSPYWMAFLPEADSPLKGLAATGGTSFGSNLTIASAPDPALVNQLAAIFRNNPAALRQQKHSIAMLIARLHGNHHTHNHDNEAAHLAEHQKDREYLKLITSAICEAFPELKPARRDVSALAVKPGVMRDEKEALLVLINLSNRYAPEQRDGNLIKKVRGFLATYPAESAKAKLQPEQSFLNKLPWHLLMTTAMLAKPTVDLGQHIVEQFQPAPIPAPTTEHVITQDRSFAEDAEKGSIYLGTVSLALYMTLLKRGRDCGTGDKLIKSGSLLGHFGTELSLIMANLASAAEQYPHIAQMLLQIGEAAKEQIIENMSDIAVTNCATDLAHSLSQHLPGSDTFKKNAELMLSAGLSVAATYTIDSALELFSPVITAGLTTALAGYGVLKAGTAVKKVMDNRQKAAAERDSLAAAAPPRRQGWLQRAMSFAAGVLVTVTGFLGFNVWQSGRAPVVVPPPQPQPEIVQKAQTSFSAEQQQRLVASYTDAIKQAQKMGGSAADNTDYTPHDPEGYISRSQAVTNLPAATLEQAKQNIANYTESAYNAMDAIAEVPSGSVLSYFTEQYKATGANTPAMIENTLEQWQQNDTPSPSRHQRDTEVTSLLAEIKAFQEAAADKDMVMPKVLDACGQQIAQRCIHLLEKGTLLSAQELDHLRDFIAAEVFERGNKKITVHDITLANAVFQKYDSSYA